MTRWDRGDLKDLKLSAPLAGIAGKHGKLSRANAKGVRAGACICTPKRGKSPLWVNEKTGTWGCLYGGCGGDVFSFLEQFEGLDFKSALEFLGGGVVQPGACAVLTQKRREDEAARALREAALAEKDRAKAFGFWKRSVPIDGTLAGAYFKHRGLAPVCSKALRFSLDQPYWATSQDGEFVIVHRGPCLLAAIQGPDSKFLGLHRTWLDPRLGTPDMPKDASGKAAIAAADGTPLPPKKMRGRKQGGAIRLHEFGDGAGERVFLAGEGIETVETVYQALVKYSNGARNYAAWAAGDLGNLAGGAKGESKPHPSKPLMRIPCSEPDPHAPGMMPPAFTDRAILLGDGDSDPIVTGALLKRAAKRWRGAGLPTELVMSPRGRDFNDLARVA